MNCFKSAVEAHLEAIAKRDIMAFVEFLSPAHNCIIILPNGNMIEGYENVISFHKEWFEDLDWRMDVEVIDMFATENTGYTLLDIVYHDLDESGKSYYELNYFLSLLFTKVEDKWILLRDQNTLK